MINRVYIKNCLSFKEVDLEFKEGLNIFTGPSGAGKSVLMSEILSLFAINDVKAELSEVTILDSNIEDDNFSIEKDDDIIIKSIKKEKTRYLLNNQSISRKNLKDFSSKIIKHLNLKDISDFESIKIIEFLDRLSSKNDKNFTQIKDNFEKSFKEFSNIKRDLKKLEEDEKRLEDLKEFARFEISKIEEINPKIDEYEELNSIKKALAKKDKIEKSMQKASAIFNLTSSVNELLELIEVDSSFFDEAINELNNIMEKSKDSIFELEDINIEEVLDRIEKISGLQKRFGSIKEALDYKDEKKKELDGYLNISFEKEKLEKRYKELELILDELAQKLTLFRSKTLVVLEEKINYYLNFLHLNSVKIELLKKELDFNGFDEIEFTLNSVSLSSISSGEYNRLRLALLSSISDFELAQNGILFLDEIDSNLSGKESEAIAKVLEKLSKTYQIFAISHQIQLSSCANQHFLVEKKDGVSSARLLQGEDKIIELARMISGENISTEALEFAKNLINN